MDKILKSNFFVFLTPMISFVLFLIAGVQLSYLPVVSGIVKGMTYV